MEQGTAGVPPGKNWEKSPATAARQFRRNTGAGVDDREEWEEGKSQDVHDNDDGQKPQMTQTDLGFSSPP